MINPLYPHDDYELSCIERLLNKIPEFQEKLDLLSVEIEKLAKQSSGFGDFEVGFKIQAMIYRAFYADLADREFSLNEEDVMRRMSKIFAEARTGNLIPQRNVGCEICGENRSVDRCHIIPNRIGGSWDQGNILILCPTHHRLFDRFMLSKAEWLLVDWDRKSDVSRHYAESVIFELHQKFWEKVESGCFERISQFEIDDKPFIVFVINQIIDLFTDRKAIKRSGIYKVLDSNIVSVAKKIVPVLIECECIAVMKVGSVSWLTLNDAEMCLSSEVVLKVFQKT